MTILDKAISPSEAVDRLAAKGVHISERALRKRARELGACRVLGKAMLLLPEHIDQIISEPEPCRTYSNAGMSGGTHFPLVASATEEALRRLTRNSQKISPQRNTGERVVPMSTAQKRY